jgi:hypothetical protein
VPALLVCVDGSASEDDARACREHFEILAQREWTYRPAFVDQFDDVPVTSPEQLPVLRTVGVVMALPDVEAGVDEGAVRQDVAGLVESMSGLARRAAIELVVEYRDEAVGFLDGGAEDALFVADFFGDK